MRVSEAIKSLEALRSEENPDPEIIVMWWKNDLFEYQTKDGYFEMPSEQAIAYADERINDNEWLMEQVYEAILETLARYDAEGWEE